MKELLTPTQFFVYRVIMEIVCTLAFFALIGAMVR
jgi:hypothetical protein